MVCASASASYTAVEPAINITFFDVNCKDDNGKDCKDSCPVCCCVCSFSSTFVAESGIDLPKPIKAEKEHLSTINNSLTKGVKTGVWNPPRV